MRQVFTSPRLENVESVAGLLREQGAVQFRRVADRFAQPEPDLLERRTLGRIQLVARIHVAELERAAARHPALHLGWQ